MSIDPALLDAIDCPRVACDYLQEHGAGLPDVLRWFAGAENLALSRDVLAEFDRREGDADRAAQVAGLWFRAEFRGAIARPPGAASPHFGVIDVRPPPDCRWLFRALGRDDFHLMPPGTGRITFPVLLGPQEVTRVDVEVETDCPPRGLTVLFRSDVVANDVTGSGVYPLLDLAAVARDFRRRVLEHYKPWRVVGPTPAQFVEALRREAAP